MNPYRRIQKITKFDHNIISPSRPGELCISTKCDNTIFPDFGSRTHKWELDIDPKVSPKLLIIKGYLQKVVKTSTCNPPTSTL